MPLTDEDYHENMAVDTTPLESPTFLQRTADRGAILDTFLNDLTQPSEEFPGTQIEQPDWGAVYTVGAHLAVKHPSERAFFRHAGDPDFNIYKLPYEDILTVLTRYEFVLKTAAYPTLDQRLLLYETFDHELNDEILPTHSQETSFLTVADYGDGEQLYCVTAFRDSTVEDGDVTDVAVETHPVEVLPEVMTDAASLYLVDSDVVPSNLSELFRQ